MKTNITALVVRPVTEPIYSERATTVQIVDEAAGAYVEVEQSGRSDIGKIAIEDEEWPALRAAINRMVRIAKTINEDTP